MNFSSCKNEAHNWITLSPGEYYPDILPLACELYSPVLVTFGQLLEGSYSSEDLLLKISELKPQWMRIQVCRVFRKYVSPETPVEMLKKKSAAKSICENFGKGFRHIVEVQKRFKSRPIPDEAICAILWEYKDRGKKGYDLTEQLFTLVKEKFPSLKVSGPERAGRDIILGEIFDKYPKPDRPVDFILEQNNKILAIGLARYDGDRGGAQEDDRTGQYRDCALEFLNYKKEQNIKTKIIFLNDGPGLLLGSMWDDYSYIDKQFGDEVKVVTLRMFSDFITMNWLNS